MLARNRPKHVSIDQCVVDDWRINYYYFFQFALERQIIEIPIVTRTVGRQEALMTTTARRTSFNG